MILFRGLWRLCKWALGVLFLLLVIAVAGIYFLFGTESGYQHVPGLINRLTPLTIDYDRLQGRLLGTQRWENLHIRDDSGLNIRLGVAEMDFDWQALFSRRVHIRALHVAEADIDIAPGAESKAQDEALVIPDALPHIHLPVDVMVDKATLDNIFIHQGETAITRIDDAHLNATYKDGDQLRFALQTQMTQWRGNIEGELQTKADYPVTLGGAGIMALPGEADSDVRFAVSGSVLNPELTLESSGGIAGRIAGRGKIDLARQALSLSGDWQDIAYGEILHAERGALSVEGTFVDIQLHIAGNVAGEDIPPADIVLDAKLQDYEHIRDINLVVKALGGEASLQGEVALGAALTWRARLQAREIDGRGFSEDLALVLDGEIDSEGSWQHGVLDAQATINTLAGSWQGQAIAGHGSIAIRDRQISADGLMLELAGNRLEADGQAGIDNAELQVRLDAAKLENILPGVHGNIQAQGRVHGNLADPQLDIAADWKNIRIEDGGESALLESSAGTVHLLGAWRDLAVSIDGKAQGRDFPALHAKGTTQIVFADGSGKAQDIDLDVATLNGKLKATGEVAFLPDVQWDIRAEAKGIEPQAYIDTLEGKVDAVMLSRGKLRDGKVEMDSRLQDLSGQWQGQKLGGKGGITMLGDRLMLDGVAFAVGANHVDVDGYVEGETLDIRFKLDGKNLTGFYPELQGQLHGAGHLQGNLAAPQVQADLKGDNLAFADYRLGSLEAKLNSSLQKGGAFDNHIVLKNVRAAGREWAEVRLDTAGRFDAHTVQVQSKGGDYNIDLEGKGGLDSLTAWRGNVQRLQASGEGLEWALQKPAALEVSPQAINVKDFCLADRYSGLCLSLQHNDSTLLTYDISKIDPRSAAAFIPDVVTLETALSGKGQVRIDKAGKMLGETNIQLTPGRVVIRPPKQAPVTLKIREGVLESAFTGNEARTRLNLDFVDSGTIQGTMVVRDYQALNLDGQLQLNIPDIGRFAYLIPKVSEMAGKVQGDLRIGGNAAKPVVSGEIILDGGVVKIPEYATDLRDIRLNLKAERSGQIDIKGNIGTPEGHLDANGVLYLNPLKMDLKLVGDNMLIADSKTMRVLVSPKFDINIDPDDGIVVQGQVDVPEARIDIPDTSGGESISEDVVIVNGKEKAPEEIIVAPSSTPMRATIAIRLGDQVYFANQDVELHLIGGMDINIRPGRPVSASGTIEVASGHYELYGQELNIKRGRVTFAGRNIANPSVDVLALREIGDVDVGARVSGTVKRLRLDLTSNPSMPDSAILSYLLFGRAPDGAMDSAALIQTAASIGLKGVFPDDLAEKTGLDVFDLGVTGLKAGKNLSEDIYVGMRSNFFTGLTEFLARYQFNKRMSMEVTASGESSAVDFLYQFEKD